MILGEVGGEVVKVESGEGGDERRKWGGGFEKGVRGY